MTTAIAIAASASMSSGCNRTLTATGSNRGRQSRSGRNGPLRRVRLTGVRSANRWKSSTAGRPEKETVRMPAIDAKKGGRWLRGLAVPALLWILVIISLREPLLSWLGGEQRYDASVLREWIKEARVGRPTLPEMIDSYLAQAHVCQDLALQTVPPQARDPHNTEVAKAQQRLAIEREKIEVHLE